jgi:3-oxoacyl-[acyl-carrier protein] reductase
MKNFLVFGATGSIGEECVKALNPLGTVIQGSRDYEQLLGRIDEIAFYDAVIWAQGLNTSDSIDDFDSSNYQNVLEANLTFLINSANWLIKNKKTNKPCQFIVISSVWSQIARPNKLTYSITKAAVSAAVRSMAVDLGPIGTQVNSISPGPLESPMTKQNLTSDQIAMLIQQSPLKRLVKLSEIGEIVSHFANGEMSGITGQDIIVDGGWSVSKLV